MSLFLLCLACHDGLTNDNFARLENSNLEYSLAGAVSRMSASPVLLLLLCLLLPPCRPLDVFHLDPDPNTPKDMAVSPSITIAEDPVGKLPPQFSLCASFYQSLRTRATGDRTEMSGHSRNGS